MAEDAATVLEQFINDGWSTPPTPSPDKRPQKTRVREALLISGPLVANLPAEIAHIYEEIQAKDRVLKEHRDSALARDNSLQKFIKNHGSHTENPKEAVYVEQIRKSHKKIEQIQDEKLVLAKKAVDLVSFLMTCLQLCSLSRTPSAYQACTHTLPYILMPSVFCRNHMYNQPVVLHSSRYQSLKCPAPFTPRPLLLCTCYSRDISTNAVFLASH